jgi:hypothetical protein
MPEKEMLISRNLWFYRWSTLNLKKLVKALLEQIETIVKLIRSRIGIYFITQNPMDVPSGVLAQLG